MNETKTVIFGVTAGFLMTIGLIVALNSYVTRIQTVATQPVVHFEPVTVTADRPRAASTLADTDSKPASL